MTEYEPGTVAKATVRGVPDVKVFKLGEGDWALDRDIEGLFFSDIAESKDVTDIRPLVVLDLAPGEADELANYLQGVDMHLSVGDRARIARQIRQQTKPPRIPEPGLWGVVEARVPGLPARRWVHHEEDRWICDNDLPVKYWDDLIDPVLVREGVE